MTAASMRTNRYFDDDDDSSTASIRTEDEYDNAHANYATTTNSEDPRNPTHEKDDDAAIAAQYAKRMNGSGRHPTTNEGDHSSNQHDTKRRKVDARPKITVDTILDPHYGMSQLVTTLPARMKAVTPDHVITSTTNRLSKTNRNAAETGRSEDHHQHYPTSSTAPAAAQKYLNTLLQAYYDIIMNDWLQIPSLTSSSSTNTTTVSNGPQQQILQDVFYKVETLGLNKGPLKDAMTSLRHVHCRNPLLYQTIGVTRTNAILQQYEQEQQEQALQQAYTLGSNDNGAVVEDPPVDVIPNPTTPPPTQAPSLFAPSSVSTSLNIPPTHTTAPSSVVLNVSSSTTRTTIEAQKDHDSDDDAGDEAVPRLPLAPKNVPLSSSSKKTSHFDDDDDDDADVQGRMTSTTTTDPIPARTTQKRRYILEDSEDDE